ncbi:PARG [Symbiodinium sp. CCMP2592]|nr:PARG [Symbiodinium sp. CCMP2592]
MHLRLGVPDGFRHKPNQPVLASEQALVLAAAARGAAVGASARSLRHAGCQESTQERSLVLYDDSDNKRKAKGVGGVPKKGKRFGLPEDKPFRPLPYVELPVGLSEVEVDQFLREQRLEDLNRKLQLQQLEDVEPDIRPPSPPPLYDRQGNRLNTREVRIRKAMLAEFNRLIRYMLKNLENYVPPEGWKPQRLVKKIIIPYEAFRSVARCGAVRCQDAQRASYYGSYSGDRFGGGIGQRVGIDEREEAHQPLPGTGVARIATFTETHERLQAWATAENWKRATEIHKAAYFTRTTNEIQESVLEHVRQHYCSASYVAEKPITMALFRLKDLEDFEKGRCKRHIRQLPLVVQGVFDEATEPCIVDFANKRLGGGWLSYGCVQEEILFIERPDFGALCARSLLEMPDPSMEPLASPFSMEPNEAWVMRGAPRFAKIGWYGRAPKDALKRVLLLDPKEDQRSSPTVVAIDAIKASFEVYTLEHLKLMLQKAYTGFVAVKEDELFGETEVSTGSWGCGAFFNSEPVMFAIQALAANAAGVRLVYHTLGDGRRLAPAFELLEDAMLRKLTIAEALEALAERCAGDPAFRVIIGARGVNHKRLQEASGCRIFIRGKDIGDKWQTDEELHMPQHVHIEGDTEEQIETATNLIMPLLNPESPEFEYARTHGMQQVAVVNGFTLKKSEHRCGVCGALGHLGFDCPETEAFSYKMANVKCTICGDRGHVASDCKQAAEQHKKADREAWRRLRTHDTQYDPPLTTTGWKQSSCAGKQILQDLQRTSTPVACIYSSPTMRTMATAAAIAKELSAPGVSPAYGLNCCAAAKMVGVSSRYFARPADEGTMKGVPVSCWPPVGDVEQVGQRNRSPDGFVETVKELTSAHPSGEAVVMVSHREGIWEVLSHLHKPPTGKYCSTHYLQYDHVSKKISLWNIEDHAVELPTQLETAIAKLRIGESDASPTTPSKGRARLELPGTVCLWQTPGVAGLWVEKGSVATGEVVELLSSPQASEGEAGDFVLIRKENGIEGWTPAKHLKPMLALG